MSISFSGLVSGMDTSSWVEALVAAREQSLLTPLKAKATELNYQKTALNSVKSTFSTLLTSTQTFTDAQFGASMDIFAKNTISVSDEKKVSATVTNSTPRQNLSLEVMQLATATKVTSANSIAAFIDETSLVSNLAGGAVKEGTMSFYVGDKRFNIDVSAQDTLGDVINKMEEVAVDENGESLVDVSIQDGKFTISATGDLDVRVGSNSDTSNLMSALALKAQNDGSVQSSYALSSLNVSKPLMSVESGFYTYDENGEKVPSIKAGTFTIGSAEITVTESTTLNDLISKINSTPAANATAFFDTVQNKIVITSKQEGAFNVNIEAGTSNVTDVLGLTNNGNIISDTQELGQNSIIKLNGSLIESYSNTITSEVSGIAGLSLDLSEVTAPGETVKIEIGQDVDAVVKEVEELVKSINSMISTTDSATASGAKLQYDSSLNSLRNNIRMTMSNGVEGLDVYKSLSAIGITTGGFGASVEANTNQFQVDTEKLKDALTKDPEAVKALLIGDKEKGITGIVQQIQDITEDALDVEKGFFKNRETTITSQMNNINSRIDAKTLQIENYQAMLEKKFQAMEKQIAKMQQQQSQMSSIL